MTIAGIVAIMLKNTSVVDMFWGLGIMVAVWAAFPLSSQSGPVILFNVLVSVWALRLTIFLLFTRVLVGKTDPRYTEIEKKWKYAKNPRIFGHFYMQAFFQLLLCSVFLPVILSDTISFHWIHAIATLLFLVALVGESIADWQLYSFKTSGKQGVCREGLWARSRHPNYFFEVLIWVSLALYSLGSTSHGLAWISPLSIWIIVRYMTGPYTERLSLKRKGAVFKAYQDDVPMIIPRLKVKG